MFKIFQMGLIGGLLGLAVAAQAQVSSGALIDSGRAKTGAGIFHQILTLLTPAG